MQDLIFLTDEALVAKQWSITSLKGLQADDGSLVEGLSIENNEI